MSRWQKVYFTKGRDCANAVQILNLDFDLQPNSELLHIVKGYLPT